MTTRDLELEETIMEALRRRPGRATVDLDEFDSPAGGTDASVHREQVRRAARRLADRGLVEWVQGSGPVDPSTARGRVGIRLRAGQ